MFRCVVQPICECTNARQVFAGLSIKVVQFLWPKAFPEPVEVFRYRCVIITSVGIESVSDFPAAHVELPAWTQPPPQFFRLQQPRRERPDERTHPIVFAGNSGTAVD